MEDSKVIYYDEYARKLCDRENRFCEVNGYLDKKTSKMIEKIFQWDRTLNKIC